MWYAYMAVLCIVCGLYVAVFMTCCCWHAPSDGHTIVTVDYSQVRKGAELCVLKP